MSLLLIKTIFDEEYGHVVYSILENDSQSISFYLSFLRLNMRYWRIILHLFSIKSCDFFVSIFSFFFYYFYMHMYVKHPAHSLTHSPAVPKMEKNRVEGRVEHAIRDVRVYLLLEKSNACSLLLLPLHVRCFLSAGLVRRMVVVAHNRQIAAPVWNWTLPGAVICSSCCALNGKFQTCGHKYVAA